MFSSVSIFIISDTSSHKYFGSSASGALSVAIVILVHHHRIARSEDGRTDVDASFAAGALVARAALDFERAREHALTVRATDGVTGAFADASVTLRLVDVNDCAPELEHDVYRAAVSEAAAVGDLVLQLHATDNDTGPRNDPQPLFCFIRLFKMQTIGIKQLLH